MKTLAIFLAIFNFLTGSLSTIKGDLANMINNPESYPLKSLAFKLARPEPVRNMMQGDPNIRATSAIVMDAETGKVLFAKNAKEDLAIASITKIMTGLVVLRFSTNLNETIVASDNATKTEGSRMYLMTGERMSVENLLRGMLIDSANDAAVALAEGTLGSETRFVEEMNKYSGELGLKDTHFTNVYGADDPKHYSNAEDLARLTSYALQNETFRSIVSTAQITVADVSGKFSHKLQNTNKLIGKYLNVIGVKTGTTVEAGASLVVAAKGDSGQIVVAVLLNSPERFNEGKTLLDWALKAYTWIEPL